MPCWKANHFFIIHETLTGIVILAMYVDDILPTEIDKHGILYIKKYSKDTFMLKDLGKP